MDSLKEAQITLLTFNTINSCDTYAFEIESARCSDFAGIPQQQSRDDFSELSFDCVGWQVFVFSVPSVAPPCA